MPFTTSPEVSAIPGIWVHTTLESFNIPPAAGSPAFLSVEDRAQVSSASGRRGCCSTGGTGNTSSTKAARSSTFPQVRAGGRLRPLYLTYNVLALISLKGADLLFGDEPLLRAPIAAQQAALDALAERCGLQRLLYACALDASAEGECFLEACAHQGEVYLRQVPADEMFPVGAVQPDGQYPAYVRRRVRNAGTDEAPILLLLEVTYLARADRAAVLSDRSGRRGIERSVALEAWDA